MTDPIRHFLAGLMASAAFLFFFFALSLKAVVAAPIALTVYVAAMLMTRRRPPPAERVLADDVTEAELNGAVSAMRAAAQRLKELGPIAPKSVKRVLAEMSGRLLRLAEHHVRDPRDLRHTRRFIRHDLDRLVSTCESFVDLAARARDADAARIDAIGARIQAFAPALAEMERACVENDFMRLEVEAEVLSEQIGR